MRGPVRALINCGTHPGAQAPTDPRVHVTSRGDVLVARLAGRLACTATGRVRHRLLRLLSGVPSVIVIDASGLSARRGAFQHLLAQVATQNNVWPRVPIVTTGSPRTMTGPAIDPETRHSAGVAPSTVEALTRIARLRARPRRTTPLPAGPLAASRARAIVGLRCRDRGVEQLAEPAQLVASELVTNAVRHAGYGIRLTVEADEQCMAVEVRDADPAPPELRQPQPLDEGGRGLAVVNAAVTAWGCLPTRPGGKVVWAAWALSDGYADTCSAQS